MSTHAPQPAETQPAETQPAGSQPAGSQPAGSQPAGSQPARFRPAENQPAMPLLIPGDRVPHFKARTRSNPQFTFDSVGGRWIVLGFYGSLKPEGRAAAVHKMMAASDVFDDQHACLFMVSADAEDEAQLHDAIPGRRIFWDFDLRVARLYGAAVSADGAQTAYGAQWMLIDPCLTLRHMVPMTGDDQGVQEVLDRLRAAPAPETYLGFAVPPPVLILPDVFEASFCDHLIDIYHKKGAEPSGFMRDKDGQTVGIMDASFKVRRDCMLDDPELIRATQARVQRKVIPQIARVHYFQCTRMERYMVGGYPADEGGHFRPHRDNTTLGTAHRRFAVSINLNDDFEGGAVAFPEYSPHGIKAPRGAAVIFSCSLLHAVGKVTSGTRYAFLPFLYDDAAAKLREANAAKVSGGTGYKADQTHVAPGQA